MRCNLLLLLLLLLVIMKDLALSGLVLLLFPSWLMLLLLWIILLMDLLLLFCYWTVAITSTAGTHLGLIFILNYEALWLKTIFCDEIIHQGVRRIICSRTVLTRFSCMCLTRLRVLFCLEIHLSLWFILLIIKVVVWSIGLSIWFHLLVRHRILNAKIVPTII